MTLPHKGEIIRIRYIFFSHLNNQKAEEKKWKKEKEDRDARTDGCQQRSPLRSPCDPLMEAKLVD